MSKVISDTIQAHIVAKEPSTGEYLFLALHRAKDSYLYPSMWQVVTGRIEDKETALEAALREVAEETSLTPEKIWTLPYIANYFDTQKDIVHCSPVFGILTDFIPDVKISQEHQAFEWLSYKKCIERVILPTHKEGTKVFRDFILFGQEPDTFLINL